MGQRSVISTCLAGSPVEDLTDDVEHLALGDVAHGHRDLVAGVADFLTADHAVGRLQRDGANEVVTEVLSDLEGDLVRLAVDRDGGLQRVVDVGNRVVGELDVNDRTRDACDAADDRRDRGRVRLVCGEAHGFFSFVFFRNSVYLPDDRASAPPTISAICCVISAWRALLRRRV